MLEIIIEESEGWDEANERFIRIKRTKLQLEHSLISLSKWESHWCKPFLTKEARTNEEMLDYVKCMTINKNVDPSVYSFLTKDDYDKISEYIDAPMTATVFYEDKKSNKGGSKRRITSELIYYWMIALNIPVEFEKWHVNRLLTLIKLCNYESQPDKKMSKKETAKMYASINAARRKKYNSKG